MATVLLFNPPVPGGGGFTREGRCTQEAGVWATQWPPLSLTTAASLLEQDGHHVTVLDCPAIGMNEKALLDEIQKNPPDFAIWSTATQTLASDLAIAGKIKSVSERARTAVFGTHVTARPEEALSEPALDAVIRGEPESVIQQLCVCSHGDWKKISGISCRPAHHTMRTGSGSSEVANFNNAEQQGFRHNPEAEFLPPEHIPSPAWHLVDRRSYRLPLKGRLFLMVAPVRGCPYRCSFCTAPLYYGTKLRQRPIPAVIEEMERNIRDYCIHDVFIWADTFTADRAYVREFCRAIIERRLPVLWTCNSRVDTIDEETLSLMKKAGLWMISYGLESGNNGILERSGKKMTVAQSRKAVLWAKKLGIRVAGHFIFGLPGETETSMEETLSLAVDLPLDIAQFYAAAPFPGTKLYAEAEKEGWLIGDTSSSQNSSAMNLPGLPASVVNRYRHFAFRKFYGRPKAMMNLMSMAEWEAVKNVPAAMKRFVSWAR